MSEERIWESITAIKDDIRTIKSAQEMLEYKCTELTKTEVNVTAEVLTEIKALKTELDEIKKGDKNGGKSLSFNDWRTILLVLGLIFGGSAGGNAVVDQLFGQKTEQKPPKVEYVYPQNWGGEKAHSQSDRRAPKIDGH